MDFHGKALMQGLAMYPHVATNVKHVGCDQEKEDRLRTDSIYDSMEENNLRCSKQSYSPKS